MLSRARKEASAQEVRVFYKHFAKAKHIEWKFRMDNELFDSFALRQFKPNNYIKGRWVFTIKTRQARQLPQDKSEMGIKTIPSQTNELPADRCSCFHQTWISDKLPDGSQQKFGFYPH